MVIVKMIKSIVGLPILKYIFELLANHYMMKKNQSTVCCFVFVLSFFLIHSRPVLAQSIKLETKYVVLTISDKGFITSILDKKKKHEYNPEGLSSALLSLSANDQNILPVKVSFNKDNHELSLSFPNGSKALIKAEEKQQYLKFKLLSLSRRAHIDNIIWGPYKTNISKTIGDIVGVVRSDDFAIGLLGLDDNTTSGPPTGGDMSFMYYYIHSSDPKKYPLPSDLKEGQTFTIGGDGINDVAFYSHPEDYYRMNYGNGARLEPDFGSTVCMHSRDRRIEQMIRFPVLPDNLDGKANSARYQLVPPADADYIGSSVAFFACPDSLGLQTIERIVLDEGLPHPVIDGLWIKDSKAYRPDIAWYGVHDSLLAYANQLGIKGIQDEGLDEYYPNPGNRWKGTNINFTGTPEISLKDYGSIMKRNGIRYGLHTLCEFLQPDNNSDVAPVPSDSLAIMQRSIITEDISQQDTMISVSDTVYFNEYGGWEGNHTNILKIGKELIEYNGITRQKPYTFLNIRRGLYGTLKGNYKKGTPIVKLQPNCYHGFAPDMNLQNVYADYYAKWLTEGGMDYIDFDGLESCMYQGQGQYSFKQFFRRLFDSYKKNGGTYLRVMGSAVCEGNWHYMSVCNVGGDNNMFNPVLNKWGIEGKDMRYVLESSYLPATFGIVSMQSDWTLYDAGNLEAKSIGWNATYMLGLSQESVENNIDKNEIFKSFRSWEDARSLHIFTNEIKERLKDTNYKFHLVQDSNKSFTLYPIREIRIQDSLYARKQKTYPLFNEFVQQPLELVIRLSTTGTEFINGLKIGLPNGSAFLIHNNIPNGAFIILKNNDCYLADKNRRKIEDLGTGNFYLPSARSAMQISTLRDSPQQIKFEVIVSATGDGIKL